MSRSFCIYNDTDGMQLFAVVSDDELVTEFRNHHGELLAVCATGYAYSLALAFAKGIPRHEECDDLGKAVAARRPCATVLGAIRELPWLDE